MGEPVMTPYYMAQLEEARKYQDFVKHELYKRGIPIVFNDSTHYQYDEGENILGIEIKNDKMFRDTGNLYIEVEEKADANNKNYVKSGILRNDNSWLYLIGDYLTVYIFAVNLLVGLYETKKYKNVEKPTSRGFLLPLGDANKYAARVIEIKKA